MKTAFPLVLSAAAFCAALCQGSVLGDLAASMKAGEWRDLAAGGMDYNMLYYDVNGDYTSPVTDYSDNLTWDPGGDEALFVGSGNYYTWKFLRYSAASNAWRSDPNLPACLKNRSCSWHAFDNLSIDAVNRTFYLIVSSGLFTYSIQTAQWSTVAPLPSGMAVGVGSAMEFIPPRNSLASVVGGKVTLYNLVTQQVTTAATGLSMSSYNQVMAYSAPFATAFFGGDGAGNFYGLDSAGAVKKLAQAPGRLHEAYSTLTADPVTGEVLYLGDSESSNAGKLFAYNPASNVWRLIGSGPIAKHALAAPVPNHGAVLFLFPSSYKTYVYKHAGGLSTAVQSRERAATHPEAFPVALNPQPLPSGTALRIRLLPNVRAGVSSVKASLFDLRGRKVAKKKLAVEAGRETEWNLGHPNAGVYLLELRADGHEYFRTLSILR